MDFLPLADWLLNSSLIDKFNDRSKHSWRARARARSLSPGPAVPGQVPVPGSRARQECFDGSLNLPNEGWIQQSMGDIPKLG